MWLSGLSVWGSLLMLVASQSCPDPSENSASWVRLKPLGQCKDGESTCPYRITLPPLTVQLPKSFRELEKMTRELQSLTQMVNQLKEDCRECKERQGMDWDIRTDNEGEDGERTQASRGTLNTRKRQQDIAKRESTVQVTTSRSAVEDTMLISSEAKKVNPTAFGKQRNTYQERNVNPHTTKPRARTNEGPSNHSQEKTISGSMSKAGEVPSLTSTKKKIIQSPVDKLTESSFSGDLDSEQPTEHEKHKANKIKLGHEMYPGGTLTAKGKVKSIPEYQVVTRVTEDDDDDDDDDDVETKQLQTPKGDKVLGERRLVTSAVAQNNAEHEPIIKQLMRNQQDKQDKKEVGDTGLKETRSYIFDDTSSGNVANEGSARVIQQPNLKSKGKEEVNNHSASSIKPKPLNPGVYSDRDAEMNSRPVNTADAIRGEKKLTSPVTGRLNTKFNASQISSQTLEMKPKNAFKPDTDAKTDPGIESTRFNTAETVSGQATSQSPISGMTYGIVDASLTNPQILDSKKQLNGGTNSESDAGMNPVNNVDTVSSEKNSRLPISDSANATAEVDVIKPKIQKNNTQISLKSSRDAENKTGMDLNPVNKIETSGQETSRSPSAGITDDVVDVHRTNPQILDGKKRFGPSTDSGSDAVMDSNPVNNVDTVSGLNHSGSFISDRANSTAEVDLIYTQSLNSQNPFTHGIDVKSNIGTDPFNTSQTVSLLQMPKSPTSDITDAVNQTYSGRMDGTFKNLFKPGTEKVSPLEMPQLSVTGRADATVNVKQMNPQSGSSNSEKTFNRGTDSEGESTEVSTPVHRDETVSQLQTSRSPISGRSHPAADQRNPRAMDYIAKNPLKPGTISDRKAGIYPNQDHTTDTVRQRETSESPISDSRLDVSGPNPSLNSNGNDLPKRRFLPKSKLNVTQPRNGRIKSSNPMSIDTERKRAQRNNKTSSLRSDAMTSGGSLPTGLFPMRQETQKEITNQPEKSPSKDPRHKKTYILQKKTINKSKSFGSGGPQNTSGVTDYTMNNGTTHTDSKTVPTHSNKLKSMAYDMTQSVMPTLSTQGILNQAHTKRAKTAPTVKVLHGMANHHIESTSQTTVTKPRLEKPDGISGQDLILDPVSNIGRDSHPPVLKETKGTDRRTGITPFRTGSADSNHENHKKALRVGGIQNRVSSKRNELKYPTTAATPYTIKTEFRNKQSKTPQFIPAVTTPHFMDQGHAEQAKPTSGVKASNNHVHHRLENPSQERESKRSHSDAGNKELQSASNGQGSGTVTGLQPNSLDSIQNRVTGPMAIIMDIVKASTDSKVSTTPTESTYENKARDINPVVTDKVEVNTEVNRLIPSSDNAPVINHRYSKTLLESVEGHNGGYSTDNNNRNTYQVPVNRMAGATLHKIPAGHSNNEDKTTPLIVNNMDDRQGLEKQLLSNCHGQCDRGPTPRSVLNSHESPNDDRDKSSQDCSDFKIRNPTSGIYNVTPNGSNNRTFPVFCDMKSSGGGWTLIQHRYDGSINFSRTWNDYKKGFGNLTGEFWLGNDKIHWLTATKTMVLRIELEDLEGVKEYAQYDHFHVANESQYYRLTIEGYSGTAGDAMQYSKNFNHNQKNFTTPDRDNDQYASGNCGDYYSSGWWFDACMAANLNGKYYETRYKGVRNGIFWGTWHNISTESYLTHDRQSFKTVRMMIRPRTGLLMD